MSSSRDYLRALAAQAGRLTLPLDPGLPLEQLYQPLVLRLGGAPLSAATKPGDEGREQPAWYYHDLDDLDASLGKGAARVEGGEAALARSAGRRMVVLGGPGAGKTTLLRALTLALARAAEGDREAPLPLLIDLPALDVAPGEDMLARCAARAAGSVGQGKAAAGLLAALRGGRAVVCLDGLDEVAPARREAALAWLRSLKDQPGAWVVGSRYTQYRSGDLGKGVFSEWELLPLDAPARERLARGILAARKRDDVGAFLAALDGHPQAASWQGTPLLFSMVASQWAERGELPGSRSELYRLAVDALLGSRLASPGDRAGLREALGRWGLELFRGGRAGLSEGELRERIAADLEGSDGARAEALFQAARGLLQPGAALGHRTQLEYLAGLALAQALLGPAEQAEKAWALAWSKRYFSRWTEPLRLMVGVLVHERGEAGVARALAWVDALLRQRASSEGDPGDLLVTLAIRSLGEIGDAPSWPRVELPGVEAFVKQWAELVLGGQNRQMHDAQRFAGELARLRVASLAPALDRLSEALRGRDEQRRLQAAQALGWLGPRAPVEDLVAGVGDGSEKVQRSCLAALRQVGAGCPPGPVIEALKSPDEWVRGAAAELLGSMGSQAPIEPLLALLENGEAEPRKAAMKALCGLGERAPLPALIKATRDDEWEIRAMAVEALGKQGPRAAASKAAVGAIYKQLTAGDRYGMVAAALRALRALDQVPLDRWVPAALEVMSKERRSTNHASVAGEAAEVLASLGDRAPIAGLIELLSEPRARPHAEKALVRLAPLVPAKPLEKLLKTGAEEQQIAALRVLGHKGDQAPVGAMKAALASKKAPVRQAAVRALGKLGERAPLDAIEKATGDRDEGVSSEAYVALARNIARSGPEKLLAGVAKLDKFALAYLFDALAGAGHRAPASALVPIGKACLGSEGQDELVTVEQLMTSAARCFGDRDLLEAMREPEAIGRSMAAWMLGQRIEQNLQGDVAGELLAMASKKEKLPRRKRRPSEDEEYSEDGVQFELRPLEEVARELLDTLGVGAPHEHLASRQQNASDEAARSSLNKALHLALCSTPALAAEALAIEERQGTDQRVKALAQTGLLGQLIEALGKATHRADLPRALRQQATMLLLKIGDQLKPSELVEVVKALGPEPLPTPVQKKLWKLADEGAKNPHDFNSPAGVAIEALRSSGASPQIASLLGALASGQKNVSQPAIDWLTSLGEQTPVDELQALVSTMKGENGYGKMYGGAANRAKNATLALGHLGDRAPIELLQQVLTWPSSDMREAAARSLAQLGARAPLAPIVEATAHDDKYVRQTAFFALDGRSEPEAIAALTRGLADEASEVRALAAIALDTAGASRPELLPVDALIEAARDERDSIRSSLAIERAQGEAARTLRGLGEATPLDRLAHLEGSDAGIEALCYLAGHMKTRAPLDRLDRWATRQSPQIRSAVALAWLRLKLPLTPLYPYLETLDHWAVDQVATSLACERSPGAHEALRSLENSRYFGKVLVALTAVPAAELAGHIDWFVGLTRSDQPATRARAIALLAHAAPAELERLAREALAPFQGGQAGGGTLADQLDALGSLPDPGPRGWALIEQGLGDPSTAVQLAAIRRVKLSQKTPDAPQLALWKLWMNGEPPVKKAAGEALGALLSTEGPPEDDET